MVGLGSDPGKHGGELGGLGREKPAQVSAAPGAPRLGAPRLDAPHPECSLPWALPAPGAPRPECSPPWVLPAWPLVGPWDRLRGSAQSRPWTGGGPRPGPSPGVEGPPRWRPPPRLGLRLALLLIAAPSPAGGFSPHPPLTSRAVMPGSISFVPGDARGPVNTRTGSREGEKVDSGLLRASGHQRCCARHPAPQQLPDLGIAGPVWQETKRRRLAHVRTAWKTPLAQGLGSNAPSDPSAATSTSAAWPRTR